MFQYQQPNVSAAIGSTVDLRCEIDTSIPAELVWHRLSLQTQGTHCSTNEHIELGLIFFCYLLVYFR
jgi:hypothetical protein